MKVNRTVVIVQRRLTHYRVELFELMRERLAKVNITLRVLVGEPAADELVKRDSGKLEWSEKLPTYYIGSLCWQPFKHAVKDADLVIITQENKLLYNLLALSVFRPKRLAFWGHGRNMQSARVRGLKEKFKRWLTTKVDWWFAYTSITKAVVVDAGFQSEKITVLDNAVDAGALRVLISGFKDADKVNISRRLDVVPGCVGVFIGSLYKDKRLDFLIEAAVIVRECIPSFSLLIVGDGPEFDAVKKAAKDRTWIKVLGTCYSHEKAEVLAVADVILNPGLVGLGILDSFAAGVPMVTTDCGIHSPEISYLRDSENGLITANSVADFANAVVGLLTSPEVMQCLRRGAQADADIYTVERMTDNFCGGIVTCLDRVNG